MTLSEALAAASVIVGNDVHLSASEYRQRGGMMTLQFCLQVNGGCEVVEVDRHSGDPDATWPEVLDMPRERRRACGQDARRSDAGRRGCAMRTCLYCDHAIHSGECHACPCVVGPGDVDRETEARLQAAFERATRDEIAACQRAVEAARWLDLKVASGMAN